MGRVMVYPSVKCAAKSRRSRKQCGNWAIPGLSTCRFHGSGAHRDVAERRLTIATLLQNDHRPVWEVLLDAVHVADSLMQDARLNVEGADELTPRQLEALVDSTKLAHHMSRTAIDSGAYAQAVQALQRNDEFNGRLIAETLGNVLDALLDGLALPADRAREVRTWAFTATRDLLSTLDPEGGADVTVPPPPLAGLAVVRTDRPQLEPAGSAPTEPPYGTDRRFAGTDYRPATADTSAARPVPVTGTPAPTADRPDDRADAEPLDDQPVDAELVDEPDPDDLDPRGLQRRLSTLDRTRRQLSALTGLSDSAVYRARNGRAHEDELPAWRRALSQLDREHGHDHTGDEDDANHGRTDDADPVARGWATAGEEGHPLSERLARASGRHRPDVAD